MRGFGPSTNDSPTPNAGRRVSQISWDVIARALFVDNGAAAGLAKFNAQVHEVSKAAPGGTRGLRAFEGGLQSLALEAAGVQGPLGRITEGLLRFGGGSGLVLGAAAGIGVIALAYNALTKESREAAEAQQKLREELVRTAAARAEAKVPESQKIGRDVSSARDELAQLNEERRKELAYLTQITAASGGGAAQLAIVVEHSSKIKKIDEDRAALSLVLIQDQRAGVAATKEETDAKEKLLKVEQERARVARLARIEATQGDVLDYRAALRARRRLSFTSPAFGGFGTDTNDPLKSGRGTTLGQGLILGPFQGAVFGRRAPAPRFTPTDPKAKEDWIKSGAILAAGFFQAITAFKSGGAGGAFGGLGALATAGSNVQGVGVGLGKALSTVGFIGSALGGLFSLFDHSAERRQREQMAELTRIRQNTDKRGQPDHISVTVLLNGKEVSAEILGDVVYGIRRLERTNAVPVLPPSGG